jgi:RHS repeat-associated protein
MKMVGGNGSVVWSAQYRSFGEARIDGSATLTNNLRFPGHYYDQETDLHYNWNRYYQPKVGRYVRPDPIGLNGGFHLFLYVHNNPVRWIDPFGREPVVATDVLYMPEEFEDHFNAALALLRHCSLTARELLDDPKLLANIPIEVEPSRGRSWTNPYQTPPEYPSYYVGWDEDRWKWPIGLEYQLKLKDVPENEDREVPPAIHLVHEFIHVLHLVEGTMKKEIADEENYTNGCEEQYPNVKYCVNRIIKEFYEKCPNAQELIDKGLLPDKYSALYEEFFTEKNYLSCYVE